MNKKVAFCTLGCKLNFAESSQIYSFFKEKGIQKVAFNQNADYYIINTCTVTSNANKKSRNAIYKAISKNKNAIVIVTGCYTQTGIDDLKNINGIDYIFGANNKDEIIKIIENAEKKEHPALIIEQHDEMKKFFPALSSDDRTRTFLKIQDGCNYFCSYCAIPYARGRSRNASIKEILDLIAKSVENGSKEIILTGINIADFGKSTSESFIELLNAIITQNKIHRLRLGSIEPNLLTDEIITLVKDNKIIMPHFHIPLQSGDDKLLLMMNRKYDTSFFHNRINTIKKIIPEAFIGIDLIVGMNGETEESFNKTIDFIKKLDISFIHHFQYSERKNTPAINFIPKISSNEKLRRSKIISEICYEKNINFIRNNIGANRQVLFEATKKNNYVFGFTNNYIKVYHEYDLNLVNKIINVKISDYNENFKACKAEIS